MKIREILNEIIVDRVPITILGEKHSFDIFKNPTRDELKSIKENSPLMGEYGNIRFCFSYAEPIFYAWSAEVLHVYVALKLGIPYPNNNQYFFGDGSLKGNKIYVDSYMKDIIGKRNFSQRKINFLKRYLIL